MFGECTIPQRICYEHHFYDDDDDDNDDDTLDYATTTQ